MNKEGGVSQSPAVRTFTAWIYGLALPSGVSAAAWKIIDADGGKLFLKDARRSRSTKSSHPRGAVAAGWGVAESLPHGASVIIRSNFKYVVDGINRDAERWQSEGFRLENGKQRPNWDLWQKFLAECKARNLRVRAVHVSKNRSQEDTAAYRQLAALARDEATAKGGQKGALYEPRP